MKKSIRIIKLAIIILLFVLSCSLIKYKTTYGVYRQTLRTTINLTVLDPNTLYDIEFDNGDNDPNTNTHYYKTLNSQLGTLPTPTKTGYNFAGWYTDTNYTMKINPKNTVSGDITYYAKWVKIVCEKAVAGTLHQEECSYASNNNKGCKAAGKNGQTLTYGNIPDANSYSSGDAYNCDVNDDGIFDPDEERFYLIREKQDTQTMVMYYYTSIDENGLVDTQEEVSQNPVTYYQPGSYYFDTAITYAPLLTAVQNSPLPVWDNPGLVLFDNKPSRLLTIDDVVKACGSSDYGTSGYLDNCEYLMENSKYQAEEKGRSGIWLEKISVTSGNDGLRLHTQSRNVASVNTTTNGSNNQYRPAIEVPLSAVEDFPDRDMYTVSFETDGGSSVAPIQKYENEPLGTLTEPTKSGYDFAGWYTDANYTTLVTESTLMPNDNITLYAYWEQIVDNMEYVFRVDGTCIFHGNPDLANNNPNYITSPDDSCIGIDKNNVSTNYTASGNERNYIDTGIALFSEDNLEKDFEVGFTIDSYNYAIQNDNQASFVNAKLENSTLNYPGFVVRKSNNKLQLTERFGMGDASMTTAYFNYTSGMKIRVVRRNKKIYYAQDNNELTELQDITNFNQTFNLNVWFGAISLESNPSSNGVGSTASRYINATLSNMYIKLEHDASVNTHQVTFYTEGGTLDMNSIRYVANNAIVGPLPTVTRAHYTFDGWYEENGSTPITTNYIITDDITFYAHFTPDSHTVTFDNKGGTPANATMTVNFNETLGTLPNAPTKSHFTFAGWYTDDENWTEQVGTQTIITGNVTFYAKWIADTHTISFDTNGGTPAPSSYTKEYGEAIGPLPTNVTKTDYIFEGWYKDNTWAEQVFDDTPVWGDAQLVARWGTGFWVTFNTQDGSYVAPVIREYGEVLGQIPAPTKQYFIFAGWYSDSDLTQPVNENTPIYQETELYAAWTLDPIYVARIGNVYYETLPIALSAITTSDQTTIVILKDITLSSPLSIGSTKDIIVDLNDYTIDTSSTTSGTIFNNSGTLRIIDSGTNGTINGGLKSDTTTPLINQQGGTINIAGGTVKSTLGTVIANNGTINISGGLITVGDVKYGIINNNATGTINMTGGSIIAPISGSKRQAIYNKGLVNIYNGATLSSASTDRATLQNDDAAAVINIYGGTIESTNANCQRGAVHNAKGTLNVKGGTITSNSEYSGTASGYGPSGIQNAGTLVIGTENEQYDVTSPVIIAKKHGVNSTTNYKVYDGIIKGKVAAVNDMNKIPSTNIEANTSPVTDTEVIGGTPYNILYYELLTGYTVTFDPGTGGSVSPSYKKVPENTAVGSLPIPEKTGYVFDGWYTEGGQLADENTVVTSDETYTAHWVESVLQANITNSSMTILKAGTGTINVTNTATIEPFTYSSNDPSIATVSSSGVVTGVNPGITQIVLTGELSDEIKHVLVTVNYSNEIETYDIMSTPMRTYFNNIDIWAKDQTDDNHTSYDSYMNSNLSTNDCINFNVDDRQTKSSSTGTNYCDLPKHYNTGVTDNLHVYEYNPATNTNVAEATYVTVNNGEIYNVIPGKTYYWESVNDSTVNGKFYAFGERRVIEINNLKAGSSDTYYQTRNVRDLGGIPVTYENASSQTVTGVIKYEKLYRGEKIWGGNGNSLQYFTKLGINHEMDLRANNEPASSEEDSFADEYKIRSASKTYEIIHYGIDYNANRSNYDMARSAVVEVMNAFINDPNYSLYFHCRIGADRTGTLAYLLEGLLGVSEEDRYRDYEMTVFFGLDERTRFYYNKGSNTTKFVYMKQAIRNASANGDEEDVVAWFLKGSTNTAEDMALIQNFRSAMVDVTN